MEKVKGIKDLKRSSLPIGFFCFLILTFVTIILSLTFYKSIFSINASEKLVLTITPLWERSETSYGNDVFLDNIKINNKYKSINDELEKQGWIIENNFALARESTGALPLTFIFEDVRSLEIDFIRQTGSGKVEIIVNDKTEVIDLYGAGEEEWSTEHWKYKTPITFSPITIIMVFCLFMIVSFMAIQIYSFIKTVINLVGRLEKKSYPEYRKNLIIWSINILVLWIAYGILLKIHYSVDSYPKLLQSPALDHLITGRPINYYLTYTFFDLLKLNMVEYQNIFFVVFILLIAISVSKLTFTFYNIENTKSTRRLILINLAVIISFVNVFFLEYFLYPEAYLIWGLIYYLSASSVCHFLKANCKFDYLKALLFLLIAMNMYQAAVCHFAIWVVAGIIIKNKFKSKIKMFVDIGKAVLISIISGLSSIVISGIFSLNGWSDSRAISLNVNIIKNNIIEIASQQGKIIFQSYNLLPKYFLSCLLLFLILFFMILCIKRKVKKSDICIFMIIIFGLYAFVYFPHILTATVWMPPRTIAMIFSICSMLLLFVTSLLRDEEITKMNVLIGITLLFIIINVNYIQRISISQFEVNLLDKQRVNQIKTYIEEYENKTGNDINAIASVKDIYPKWTYDGIEYAYFDTNISALKVDWGYIYIMNYYCDREFAVAEMDTQIYEQYFEGKNWDQFTPDEQLVFKDNILYMIME